MTGLILTLLILGMLILAWRYAATRKAAITTRPKHLLSFTTDYPPQVALQVLTEKTSGSDYTIESVDEEHLYLILSTPPTATTWGFFYPVYLTRQDDGPTLVEVGIQSKLYQRGPLVRRQHERCLAYLQGALSSEGGRA